MFPLSPDDALYLKSSNYFLERLKCHGETLCPESLLLFNKHGRRLS